MGKKNNAIRDTGEPWEQLAFSAVLLGKESAAVAQSTAALEAVRALAAYMRRSLTVDTSGKVVLPVLQSHVSRPLTHLTFI